jgi:hypothetical protein
MKSAGAAGRRAERPAPYFELCAVDILNCNDPAPAVNNRIGKVKRPDHSCRDSELAAPIACRSRGGRGRPGEEQKSGRKHLCG